MQQDTDQAEKGLYFLMVWTSTGLDFNFLSDFENGTDSLEGTTEPAVEGISTLEPPSAFMERNEICWRAALRAILKLPKRSI